jgi:hypothetical protein
MFQIINIHQPTFSLVNQKVYNYIQHHGSMMNTMTTANFNRRVKYLMWANDYFKTFERTEELENCVARFFIKEYISFLWFGGTDYPSELKNLIYKIYLKNKWVVSQFTLGESIFINAYKLNPTLGKITRKILVFLRKLTR